MLRILIGCFGAKWTDDIWKKGRRIPRELLALSYFICKYLNPIATDFDLGDAPFTLENANSLVYWIVGEFLEHLGHLALS